MIEPWRRATEWEEGGDLLGKARCKGYYSVLTFKGKGLSGLKEHPKSKPHVNQNQDKAVKLWTGSFVQLAGTKKSVYNSFRPLLWKAVVNLSMLNWVHPL